MTVQDRMARLCSVTECKDKHHSLGFCRTHYRRLRLNGTTELVGRKPGKGKTFYQNVVLPYDGNECLIWPYSRSNGYGQFWFHNKPWSVHRVLCEDTNGPPPTPEHEAAHSCGNGMQGCVTKNHLSWKTPKENQDDKLIHGTHHRGERNHNAKLTEAQAIEILSLKGKCKGAALARRFGVCKSLVSAIQNNRAWLHLQEAIR